MKNITRLALGGIFGAAMLSFAPSLSAAAAIECTETANYVCCESSTGKVTCIAKDEAAS
jgi:hypothetical protein